MASFVFDKPTITPTFETPASIRIEQGDTFDGVFAQVGSDQLLSGLADNPDDATQYLVNEPLAIDTKYTKLRYVTTAGVTGEAQIIEPVVATAGAFQIVAYSADAGLGTVQGVILDIAPVGGVAESGSFSVIQRAQDETDAAGRAAIDTVPADAGTFYVNFGGHRKTIDTTGREGTSVNWKDI